MLLCVLEYCADVVCSNINCRLSKLLQLSLSIGRRHIDRLILCRVKEELHSLDTVLRRAIQLETPPEGIFLIVLDERRAFLRRFTFRPWPFLDNIYLIGSGREGISNTAVSGPKVLSLLISY
jgi:hypothetical protein